jgi:hypothetical protein
MKPRFLKVREDDWVFVQEAAKQYRKWYAEAQAEVERLRAAIEMALSTKRLHEMDSILRAALGATDET